MCHCPCTRNSAGTRRHENGLNGLENSANALGRHLDVPSIQKHANTAIDVQEYAQWSAILPHIPIVRVERFPDMLNSIGHCTDALRQQRGTPCIELDASMPASTAETIKMPSLCLGLRSRWSQHPRSRKKETKPFLTSILRWC